MLINRHRECWGIKLWKWNNFQIELWYCPNGFEIQPHSHDNQDIELTYLWGNAVFFRKFQDGETNSFDTLFAWPGKTFSIPAGTLHWFTVSNKPLIFINREQWKTKPTSAAIDFNLK
jgi:cupin superfamily acireductone dioxygenase involved in methionine salvage